MNKMTFIFLGLCILFVSFTACDDDDQVINQDELPAICQTFLNDYFSGQTILGVQKDNDEYEVYYTNYKVEFNSQGVWKQVDGKRVNGDYKAIPQAFLTNEIPQGIITWTTTNYPNAFIVEVEKEYRNGAHTGYDIELNNGRDDLDFDLEGNFLNGNGTTPPVTTTLPEAAKTFLETYFADDALRTQRQDDDSDYEVTLESGIEIDFTSQGVWKNVDGKFDGGQYVALPEAYLTNELPATLITFVTTNYPGRFIIEVDKEFQNNTLVGYEIDLNGNVELDFDTAGNLIGSGGSLPVQLPQSAQEFMNTHFNGLTYTPIPDDGEYDVYVDSYKIEFNSQGIWTQVDGTIIRGQYKAVPESFLNLEPLNLISDYLINQYPTSSIVDVEKEFNNGQHTGYEFTLNNGLEMIFNINGTPIISGGEGAIINKENLPQPALSFLDAHFTNINIRYIKQDNNEYEVYLNGYDLEFDLQGNWTKVDGYVGYIKTALPASFLTLDPVNTINSYIVTNYPGRSIMEIEKDYDNGVMHYDVKLDNSLDLVFDAQGRFIRID